MKEQKQNISKEFVQKVFTAVFPSVGLQRLTETLEVGNILYVRAAFQDVLDELRPPIEEILNEEQRLLYNQKVVKYLKVNRLYDQLLAQIDQIEERILPKSYVT